MSRIVTGSGDICEDDDGRWKLEVRCQKSEVRSPKSDVRSRESEVRSWKWEVGIGIQSVIANKMKQSHELGRLLCFARNDLRLLVNEDGSWRSDVRGQRSEVRSRESEVRSPKSEVGSQKSGVGSGKWEVGIGIQSVIANKMKQSHELGGLLCFARNDLRLLVNEDGSWRSDVRGQRSEVRSPKSEVGSQKSGVGSCKWEVGIGIQSVIANKMKQSHELGRLLCFVRNDLRLLVNDDGRWELEVRCPKSEFFRTRPSNLLMNYFVVGPPMAVKKLSMGSHSSILLPSGSIIWTNFP